MRVGIITWSLWVYAYCVVKVTKDPYSHFEWCVYSFRIWKNFFWFILFRISVLCVLINTNCVYGELAAHRGSFVKFLAISCEIFNVDAQFWGWFCSEKCTVRCCYNMVNFIKKNIHKRHPIARPLGRGMGCLFLWIQHLIDILPEFLQPLMLILPYWTALCRHSTVYIYICVCG